MKMQVFMPGTANIMWRILLDYEREWGGDYFERIIVLESVLEGVLSLQIYAPDGKFCASSFAEYSPASTVPLNNRFISLPSASYIVSVIGV